MPVSSASQLGWYKSLFCFVLFLQLFACDVLCIYDIKTKALEQECVYIWNIRGLNAVMWTHADLHTTKVLSQPLSVML